MIYRPFSCRLLSRTSLDTFVVEKAPILKKLCRRPDHEIGRYAYLCSSCRGSKLKAGTGAARPSLEQLRVYVLGVGNIGRLFAHSLAQISNRPAISLLFHRQSLAEEFKQAGRKIEIITNGASNKQSGFDYEVIGAKGEPEKPSEREPIHHLILGTKATQTLRALSSIKHRLTPSSTILFTQNGLSTTSHLNMLFPTTCSRPNVLTSVAFHGIYSTGPLFSSTHAGVGFLPIAATSLSSTQPDTHQYLLRTILELPAINAIEVTPAELLIIQLEKLVVNAIINPLTALLRVCNGQLYDYPRLEPLIRALIAETSRVVLALPELMAERENESVRNRFREEALWTLVKEKALLAGTNRSSMLQDVERGKGETEISFINGWVVKRGKELGINVPISEKVVGLVELRRMVALDDVGELFRLQ